MRVGFIGLGDQGAPIARAIAEAKFDLTVWARRPESLAAMDGLPHSVASTPEELAAKVDLIGLCLRTDADIEGLLGRLVAAAAPGMIIANHGTGDPELCHAWVATGVRAGVCVLDAPVSGGGAGARQRTLTTMVGGERDAFDRARPAFDSFSRLVVHLGPPGAGQLAKLVNNALFTANLRSAQLALDIAAAAGFDLGGLVDLLLASSGASFALEALARQMTVQMVEQYRAILGADLDHFEAAMVLRGAVPAPLLTHSRAGVDGIAQAVAVLHPEG